MAEDRRPEEVQRWPAKRRATLVISLLKGETTAADGAMGRRWPRWTNGAIASCSGRKTHLVLARKTTKRWAKKKSIDSNARWAS